MKNREVFVAYLGLIFMAAIIGLSFIFVKIGLQYGSAVDLLAHRFSIAFATVLILLLTRVIKIPQINRQKLKQLAMLAMFYPVFFFLFQTYGMQYSTVTEGGIIFAMSPIVTLLAAQIFLKEQTTLLQKFGILLSVVGILYIVLNKNGLSGDINSIEGIVLLFLSIFSFAGYIVVGKRSGVEFTPIEITVWITLIACVVFNLWSLVNHLKDNSLQDFFLPLIEPYFLYSVLYLGILSTVVTSFFTNYALPLVPASQIAVLGNLSPIFAILSGIVLLDEYLFMYQIVGGVLVIVGIGITLWFRKN